MNIILEMEIGITGGVEDGVDNSGVSNDKLYSTPEDTWAVYTALSPISEKFTIAAAFGNVHGVYKPGNVKLQPELLGSFQAYAKEKLGSDKPLFFVFQGGSGSEKSEIEAALEHGVVKINVDTDTQWAYWQGILKFYQANEDKLQGQIGNKDGPDKPNKSYCTRRDARLIDPRPSPLTTALWPAAAAPHHTVGRDGLRTASLLSDVLSFSFSCVLGDACGRRRPSQVGARGGDVDGRARAGGVQGPEECQLIARGLGDAAMGKAEEF